MFLCLYFDKLKVTVIKGKGTLTTTTLSKMDYKKVAWRNVVVYKVPLILMWSYFNNYKS